VPGIVTSGSIEVVRLSQQISVTYFDPDNQQVPVPTRPLAGQEFALAGTNGPVESLSVVNPIPGRWRIHVAAGPGLPRGVFVTTSVLWQGVLHSDFVADPADPAPGQVVTVTVKLQIGTRPLSARDLAGVHVSVRVTGASLAAPISVPVNGNGISPGQLAHDGVYTGRFTVPRSATGTLIAVGVVSAQGVTGDAHSAIITIDRNGQLVTGQMTLTPGEVAQGGQVAGTVRFSNPTGKPHTIRLVPEDTPAGVTVTPPTIGLSAASGTTSYQFSVHFARSVPTGAVTGHINATDDVTGSVYAQAIITNNVVIPPKAPRHPWSWVLISLWVLIGLGAGLAALAAALALWRLSGPRGGRSTMYARG